MTSKCTRSAPAASTASTSSPRRAKSAERIEGAIQDGCTVTAPEGSKVGSGQTRERLAVLLARARNDLGRQARTRWPLVPRQALQIVAHELLVEARRACARGVAVLRPEAR